MKTKLTSTPTLIIPTDNGGFVVYSDASHHGLGCVVMQHGKVITYTSRKLRPYNLSYPIHDLQLIVVMFALKI